MKYEMLGACLDYHRTLHLTRHYTFFSAVRRGNRMGAPHPYPSRYCQGLNEVTSDLYFCNYIDKLLLSIIHRLSCNTVLVTLLM